MESVIWLARHSMPGKKNWTLGASSSSSWWPPTSWSGTGMCSEKCHTLPKNNLLFMTHLGQLWMPLDEMLPDEISRSYCSSGQTPVHNRHRCSHICQDLPAHQGRHSWRNAPGPYSWWSWLWWRWQASCGRSVHLSPCFSSPLSRTLCSGSQLCDRDEVRLQSAIIISAMFVSNVMSDTELTAVNITTWDKRQFNANLTLSYDII